MPSLALPIELRAGRMVFTGTLVPVELFLSYVIGHGPRGADAMRDFLADFPQVTPAQVWSLVELIEYWSTDRP